MTETHKQTLEKANAAIAKGDYEAFLNFCTEDTAWTFVGEQTLNGKEAVRKWMSTAYIEPPQFTVHRMVAEGDYVIALGEISVKDEAGITSVHKYCDVWRFDAGRMAELQAFVIESAEAET